MRTTDDANRQSERLRFTSLSVRYLRGIFLICTNPSEDGEKRRERCTAGVARKGACIPVSRHRDSAPNKEGSLASAAAREGLGTRTPLQCPVWIPLSFTVQ